MASRVPALDARAHEAVRAGSSAIRSVDRAIDVLEVLAREGTASVTDVAAAVGVHKSTASRLLSALEARGLVEQVAERGNYRLGFGIVLGDIYRISNSGCTPENVTNINACYPKGMDLTNREKWLAEHTASGEDSPDNPHLYREDGKWPVIPIVHLLLGVNFKISEQFSVRVDGGFHDAFYVGAAGHYFF